MNGKEEATEGTDNKRVGLLDVAENLQKLIALHGLFLDRFDKLEDKVEAQARTIQRLASGTYEPCG